MKSEPVQLLDTLTFEKQNRMPNMTPAQKKMESGSLARFRQMESSDLSIFRKSAQPHIPSFRKARQVQLHLLNLLTLFGVFRIILGKQRDKRRSSKVPTMTVASTNTGRWDCEINSAKWGIYMDDIIGFTIENHSNLSRKWFVHGSEMVNGNPQAGPGPLPHWETDLNKVNPKIRIMFTFLMNQDSILDCSGDIVSFYDSLLEELK